MFISRDFNKPRFTTFDHYANEKKLKPPLTVYRIFNSHLMAGLVILLLGWSLWEFSDAHFRWSGGQKKVPVENNIYSDGAAYYVYLPKWFYHGGEDYSFLDKVMRKYPESRFDDNLGLGGGAKKRTNKYYTGTAALMTPFFIVGHIIEAISGGNTDGYAPGYLLMASIAAIFYWMVGVVALYLLLRRLKVPAFYIYLTIISITFGTNLFHYVVYAPTYSHVYSFACTTWLLYIAMRWAKKGEKRDFLLLGLLVGLSFIIRPTNILIVLFIPFLFDSMPSFISRIKNLFNRRPYQLLLFLILLSLPFLLHFSNLESFNSYKDEGFEYLASPYFFEVLFGVRRGIFFYAPVLLLSIFGFITLYRYQRNYAWGFLVVFSVFTYVISSWWCWWYGGSFSMRPFVDIMSVFAIPLAFVLYKSQKVMKVIALLFLFIGIWLTQVYTYQFNHQIIHYDGMNWKDFKTVFLQTDDRFEWYPYLSFDEVPTSYTEKIETIPFSKIKNYPQNKYSLTLIEDKSPGLFAGKITGDVELGSANGKPLFKLQYFKKDSVIKETDLFFGARIPRLHSSTNVTLDVYPELLYHQFDSVRITLFEGGIELEAKELTLDLYTQSE